MINLDTIKLKIFTLGYVTLLIYHPEFTEPISQTTYALQFTEETPTRPLISSHQFFLTETITKTTNSSLYNVQPTSHTTGPRLFSSLAYTKDLLKFINKLTLQFSDLTDTEYVSLCNLLIKQ